MTRTLKDYRPQHDNNCASGVTDEMGYFEHDPPVPCSCGLADLLKAGEWQPIETAPKDGTAILGYDRSNNNAEARNYTEFMRWDGERWHDPDTWTLTPTHWMPLPPPPDEVTR